MSLWRDDISLEALEQINANTMATHLGIEMIEIGANYLRAKMPVDRRTKQPLGLLHGGASVALAESLGSMAGYMTVDHATQHCVGVEINANHIRPVTEGYVYGEVRPVHVGRKTQVWEIKITNEADKLVCVSRITLAVLDH